MALTTSNELYRLFLEASGAQLADLTETRFTLQEVIADLGVVQQATVQKNKVVTSQTAQGTSGASENPLLTVMKDGLGMAPLIGGLISLFSGGAEEPTPLMKYALPATVNFQAAEAGGRITTAEYDQTGMPRAAAPATAAPAQVTVQVQAMDARSFLDRSGDIAMAVRDAMLNLNSINDVVNDL
jgi:hypothetical protein